MSRMTKTPLVMLISGMLLGTSAYAEDKLTVVSWGGAFTKSQVEAYHNHSSKRLVLRSYRRISVAVWRRLKRK